MMKTGKMITVKDERDMPERVRTLKEFEDAIDGRPVIWKRHETDAAGNLLDYCEWVAYEASSTKAPLGNLHTAASAA